MAIVEAENPAAHACDLQSFLTKGKDISGLQASIYYVRSFLLELQHRTPVKLSRTSIVGRGEYLADDPRDVSENEPAHLTSTWKATAVTNAMNVCGCTRNVDAWSSRAVESSHKLNARRSSRTLMISLGSSRASFR